MCGQANMDKPMVCPIKPAEQLHSDYQDSLRCFKSGAPKLKHPKSSGTLKIWVIFVPVFSRHQLELSLIYSPFTLFPQLREIML